MIYLIEQLKNNLVKNYKNSINTRVKLFLTNTFVNYKHKNHKLFYHVIHFFSRCYKTYR